MILIKGNVERIVVTEEQVAKLMLDGFRPLDGTEFTHSESTAEADIGNMKVAELREIAKEHGIAAADSLLKNELISVLKDVI